MKKIFWALQLVVVLISAFAYFVIKQGDEGRLESAFLRNSIYPTLVSASGPYLNVKFKIRGPRKPQQKIVIVAIDDYSIEKFGRWPWGRDVMAFVTQRIMESGAKVVGFDMNFPEPEKKIPDDLKAALAHSPYASKLADYETDKQFAEVIKAHADKIVLGWASEANCRPHNFPIDQCNVTDPADIKTQPASFEKFLIKDLDKPSGFDPQKTPLVSIATFLANIPEFNDASEHQGAFLTFPDPDGYIRRTSPIIMANAKAYTTLPMTMAAVGLHDELELTMDESSRVKDFRFKNSGKVIPVNGRGDLSINFLGPAYTFPYVPAYSVTSDENQLKYGHNLEFTSSRDDLFKDAYVFVGASAVGIYDMRAFPFDENTPGVEGHATILENILSDSYLLPESAKWTMVILTLMTLGGLVYAALIFPLEAVPNIVLSLGSLGVLAFVDQKVLFAHNQNWHLLFSYVELALISVAALGVKYVAEERQKKFIHGAFGKYVSPAVVEAIVKDPSRLSLGGTKLELSVLFSDIRSFTSFSERLDAKVLAALLYDYLGMMTDIIVDGQQGTLDKYIGDAIMAFWGAPIPTNENGFKAVRAAILMQQKLDAERERLNEKFGAHIEAGIGINTGLVSVGNMGSAKNFSYTVIGDHVNLASRVEGLTKHYGAGILTTGFTMSQIQKSGCELPAHRILDKVMVKGKNEGIELVEIFHHEAFKDHLELFQAAREVYFKQDWQKAIQLFGQASRVSKEKMGKEDKSALMYVDRCRAFEEQPPPKNWDGTFQMTSK